MVRHPLEITLTNGERLVGVVFLEPIARHHTGQQDPRELLNDADGFFPFAVEGRSDPNEVPQAWFSAVSPNYFREMGIGLLEGREFNEHDRDGAHAALIDAR